MNKTGLQEPVNELICGREEKGLSYNGMPAKKYRRNHGHRKKNPYLAKIIAITVSDKNNQWRLILVGRNTKDLVTNFTVGKPSQCHLNSVVKVCITRHRTN